MRGNEELAGSGDFTLAETRFPIPMRGNESYVLPVPLPP